MGDLLTAPGRGGAGELRVWAGQRAGRRSTPLPAALQDPSGAVARGAE